MEAHDTELGPGDLVAERYRIEALLGAGGMGRVHRARDTHLDRWVALKIMRPQAMGAAERFRREARVAAALDHPSVVRVYDFGHLPDGRPYLVLEYIVGRSLETLIAEDGPVSAWQAAELLRPVAAGLAEAHAAGIVHRDVKPANLVLQVADGMAPLVRVIDFGIAAIEVSAEERLTRAGMVFGTPAFMAPEQALGQPVSPAVDVWALGVVLHTLLAGSPPFEGAHTPDILKNVIDTAPPPVPASVPEELAALVAACLSKDPAQRPADGGAVRARLESFLTPEATVVVAPAAPAPPPPRITWAWVGAAALIVGLSVALVVRSAPQTPVQAVAAPAAAPCVEPEGPHPLEAPRRLLTREAPAAALAWLDAFPDHGPADERAVLRGLALLGTDAIAEGVQALEGVLTQPIEPDRRQRVAEALVAALRLSKGDAVLPLLQGPVLADAEAALNTLAGDGRHRTRWRAVKALEAGGLDATAARFAAWRKDTRAGDCDIRRRAVRALGKHGDPAAIPDIQRVQRLGMFDKLCFDNEIPYALRLLRAKVRSP